MENRGAIIKVAGTPQDLANFAQKVLNNTKDKFRACKRVQYNVYVWKAPQGYVFANKFEQPESYKLLMQVYQKPIVPITVFEQDQVRYKYLCQKGCYRTDGTYYVICGTQGEMWLTRPDNVCQNYVLLDGKPVTPTVLSATKWVTVQRKVTDVAEVGLFVPKAMQVELLFKDYKAYLNSQHSGGHGAGDILVFRKLPNGNPDFTKSCSPINNSVFESTFNQNVGGWSNTGYIKADTQAQPHIEDLNSCISKFVTEAAVSMETLNECINVFTGNIYNYADCRAFFTYDCTDWCAYNIEENIFNKKRHMDCGGEVDAGVKYLLSGKAYTRAEIVNFCKKLQNVKSKCFNEVIDSLKQEAYSHTVSTETKLDVLKHDFVSVLKEAVKLTKSNNDTPAAKKAQTFVCSLMLHVAEYAHFLSMMAVLQQKKEVIETIQNGIAYGFFGKSPFNEYRRLLNPLQFISGRADYELVMENNYMYIIFKHTFYNDVFATALEAVYKDKKLPYEHHYGRIDAFTILRCNKDTGVIEYAVLDGVHPKANDLWANIAYNDKSMPNDLALVYKPIDTKGKTFNDVATALSEVLSNCFVYKHVTVSVKQAVLKMIRDGVDDLYFPMLYNCVHAFKEGPNGISTAIAPLLLNRTINSKRDDANLDKRILTIKYDENRNTIQFNLRYDGTVFDKEYKITPKMSVSIILLQAYMNICTTFSLHPAKLYYGSKRVWTQELLPSAQQMLGGANSKVKLKLQGIKEDKFYVYGKVGIYDAVTQKELGSRVVRLTLLYENFDIKNSSNLENAKEMDKQLRNGDKDALDIAILLEIMAVKLDIQNFKSMDSVSLKQYTNEYGVVQMDALPQVFGIMLSEALREMFKTYVKYSKNITNTSNTSSLTTKK